MQSQAVIFIIGFLVILGLFITFIRALSHRLSEKVAQSTFDAIERIIIAGIIIGVVGMFQPWVFIGYKYGFLVLLFSTLAFIVWSHITPAATRYNEEAIPEVSARQHS
jgi:hypothetical protein